MFYPATCIYEVYKLAETRRKTDYPGCDVGTAFSMFFADVKLGRPTEGNTGGILPNFDFAAAKTAWDAMTDEEQTVALEEASRSRVALHSELAKLYPNKAAMVEAVEAYLCQMRAEAAEAAETAETAEEDGKEDA